MEIKNVDILLNKSVKFLESIPETVIDERLADRISRDSRSVHVGNVDYETTKDMLEEVFCKCGRVERITIPLNKNTEKTMGFAYILFELQQSVDEPLKMHGFMLRNRPIRVLPKIN
ncbi:PREDICTED: putative RNA-binding protein EEED8.4 [Nicrophorus vespilloides]|uniref:RNA-binding protein EEED8.4 n=1 Tax=Nicrophorus vespilloides TaxID=110193 RepID=A0ABM1M4V7_NICVS|nr:PREDICTED: putative RNA-binding protein EEED8.4 [Nicrophorus vespilloides]